MDPKQVKQAIRNDTPCPFGPRHHDLSKVRLTFSEKYWLDRTIIFNCSTAAKLSKRFSLTDKTLGKYATAFRDGTILNSKGGRSPTFNNISCKSIRVEKLKNKEAELTASRR